MQTEARAARAQVRDSALVPVAEKLASGERLSFEDGMALFSSDDLISIGELANRAREAKNGDIAYFNVNRHINPTDFCISGCSFCAFSKKPGDPKGRRMSLDEIRRIATPPEGQIWREIHVVGGLDPEFSFRDCLDALRAIRDANPTAHIKAFTLVEVDYYARIEKKTPQEILSQMRDAGLGSLPGGGAEILGEELRKKICPNKITGARWLELAKIAHQMGIRSNCTMLYGHIEKHEDRVDHILRLRSLQDETGGFMAFVPLKFQRENTPYADIPEASGIDSLKTIAISRLLFDNIDHIKVYWVMVGTKLAQTALWFGADDMDGTVTEERIGHDAGAKSPKGLSREDILKLIRRAGRTPIERDSLYNPIALS